MVTTGGWFIINHKSGDDWGMVYYCLYQHYAIGVCKFGSGELNRLPGESSFGSPLVMTVRDSCGKAAFFHGKSHELFTGPFSSWQTVRLPKGTSIIICTGPLDGGAV